MAVRGIYLVGFSGAGKSTIARLVGAQLGWQVLDLDHVIAERAGMSIPLIFEREGEPGFRLRETEALREVSAAGAFVVATGGGAAVASRESARDGQVGLGHRPRRPARDPARPHPGAVEEGRPRRDPADARRGVPARAGARAQAQPAAGLRARRLDGPHRPPDARAGRRGDSPRAGNPRADRGAGRQTRTSPRRPSGIRSAPTFRRPSSWPRAPGPTRRSWAGATCTRWRRRCGACSRAPARSP